MIARRTVVAHLVVVAIAGSRVVGSIGWMTARTSSEQTLLQMWARILVTVLSLAHCPYPVLLVAHSAAYPAGETANPAWLFRSSRGTL